MNLKTCPKCGEIIDIDGLETLDPDLTIGCGYAERDFIACAICDEKDNPIGCKSLREEFGFTLTKVKDYEGNGNVFR